MMSELGIEMLGGAAACLTTASFLPQAWKVLRERQTAGISLAMYLMFGAGVFLWLVYGLLRESVPIIAANAVTFVLVTAIIGMKVRLDRP